MKKLTMTLTILLNILLGSYAHAFPVLDVANVAQTTQTAANTGVVAANTPIQTANSALTSASTFMMEVKATLMEMWDKSAWVQQLKGLWDSLVELKNNVNELMGLRDDVMNTFSGLRNTHITDYKSMGDKSVDYTYAAQLPQGYVGVVICDADGSCSSSSNYRGEVSGVKSQDIRNAWHVPDGLIEETDVRQLTYEAAEEYAQQIAVIQAIAQEAYIQASNRVAKIEDLQKKLNGATSAVNTQSIKGSPATESWKVSTDSIELSRSGSSAPSGSSSSSGGSSTSGTAATPAAISSQSFSGGATSHTIGETKAATEGNGNPASNDPNKNDLKYIADLQARIQTEQAFLINDQNKLASLAILQQSLADAYEQRKREIAAYTISGGQDKGFSFVNLAKRTVIAAGQTAAYEWVTAAYTQPEDQWR